MSMSAIQQHHLIIDPDSAAFCVPPHGGGDGGPLTLRDNHGPGLMTADRHWPLTMTSYRWRQARHPQGIWVYQGRV
jgi:hypothetical protein